MTFNSKVRKQLDVSLVHTFVHDSVVCCVRISPDGKMLATGCNRNTTLYDTDSGHRIAQLQDESTSRTDNYIRSVAFSPDGRLIATGSEDKIIRVWDIARQSIKMVLRGHASEIYSLAFTPDGRYLVSGSGDKSARIWDVRTGETLFKLMTEEEGANSDHATNGAGVAAAAAPQYDAGVTSVAISPDNRFLAAGSLDHVVRVWDLQSGKLLDKLRGHNDSVYSVVFVPGGKQILTGSLDKTLKIWDISPLRKLLDEGKGDTANPDEQKSICTTSLSGHKVGVGSRSRRDIDRELGHC